MAIATAIGCLLATMVSQTSSFAAETVRLITLDPGHFHAGLVQKFMYPQVSPVVHVYAPAGPDLEEHLKRIEGFNTRAQDPTHWEEQVYRGPDFLERMVREKAGNVVVLAGNNARKTEYIDRSVRAGFNVLADKPMAITPSGFALLRKAFARAQSKHLLIYDIMTERYEITSILQGELSRMPDLFGVVQKGTPEHPAVEMESVHHFFKDVAGKPLIRPAWFFDVRQQGESIPDVGTHLVDAVQGLCFPEQALDWKKDVKVYAAHRWTTTLTLEQFKRATGLEQYPDFFKKDIGADGALHIYANGDVSYTLRGIHAKVAALWRFEAPPGAGDTLYAAMHGTKATLVIQQGQEQHFRPELYVENTSGAPAADFERILRAKVAGLAAKWPGLDIKAAGDGWQLLIPDKYRVGHEQHFAQVTEKYLGFLAQGEMPAWEVPCMLTKYYTTTEAYRLSHATTGSAAK
jgi:predicted dehydrogenase